MKKVQKVNAGFDDEPCLAFRFQSGEELIVF